MLLLTTVVGMSCNGSNTKADKSSAEPEGKSKFLPAPPAITEVDLKEFEGDGFKIGDFEGSVVLINLWATWCAPCIEEMPYFNELHEKYADDGFVMIGLNSDEESEALVKSFVERQKLVYKIGWAEESIVTEFFKISRLPGIPQSLLLNRKGEMIGMFRGGGPKVIEQMVKKVEEEMGEEGESIYPLDEEAFDEGEDADPEPATDEKAREAVKKVSEEKK